MRLLLAVSSAVLLILSFPNFEISFLAWFAFVPLFFAVRNSSPARSFLFSYIAGAAFFGGVLYWLTYVTKLGYLVLVLYLALFFGFFGLFTRLFLRKLSDSRPLLLCAALPALWVSLEFLRGILLTGFPWCLLGYSQYKHPLLIQIADITGAYGVSFIIVMANFVLYLFLEAVLRPKGARPGFAAGTVPVSAAIACVIAVFYIGYGYISLQGHEVGGDANLRLAVVQGNIEQFKKWDPLYRDYILDTYEGLTKDAAQGSPDLIIWPETAIPGFIDNDNTGLRLRKILRETAVPLFSGAVTYESDAEKDYFFNSAALISPDGEISQKYDKIHLVPLGEYIPFEARIPFFRGSLNVEIGDYTAGNKFTTFDIEKDGKRYKYAALICFEDIFPDLARRFAGEGADFLVNITNDAWFLESPEQLQHAQASVFRAVENRRSVIRAANNGLSCYISPKGTIEEKISADNGNIHKAGFRIFEIKPVKGKSPYTIFGDAFAYLCFLVAAGCYFIDIFRARI